MNWELVLSALGQQLASNPEKAIQIVGDLVSLANKLDPVVLADLVKAILALLPKAA